MAEHLLIWFSIFLGVMNVAQAFWINRLINKLMSRNYYDYKVSERIFANKESKDKMGVTPNLPPDEDVEDLGYLGG